MGPRAGLDRCGKSRPPPGMDPRTVQPVASRYTDYAARPTYNCKYLHKNDDDDNNNNNVIISPFSMTRSVTALQQN